MQLLISGRGSTIIRNDMISLLTGEAIFLPVSIICHNGEGLFGKLCLTIFSTFSLTYFLPPFPPQKSLKNIFAGEIQVAQLMQRDFYVVIKLGFIRSGGLVSRGEVIYCIDCCLYHVNCMPSILLFSKCVFLPGSCTLLSS